MSRYRTGITKAEKEKWVEALRSGEYKQGQGFLKTQSEKGECKYCCLGLLAEIVDPDNLCVGEVGVFKYYYSGKNRSASSPYIPLILPSENVTGERDLESVLAAMNDQGRPFHEIADWIQENVTTTD